jgi:adenosylmethionine-8-amino-7-oxononanoate transaminase
MNLTLHTKSLANKDKRYLWHPFTQMRDWEKEDILIIEKAEGVTLEDTEGKRYLDGVSSLWCNVHGHRVPEIDAAIRDQLDKVAHTTFLGLSNVPAIELAEKLVQIAPEGLTRVFYSDSGSEAVEIALKMAYQYWQQKGRTSKKKFVKLSQSYHGDTIGSVSVGGIDLFHEVYGPLLFETYSVPTPYVYRWSESLSPAEVRDACLAELEKILREKHEEIAAFVMEPLMQGAAGMILQPDGYISRARELTKKYNVLLVFDEVATGFGRTGSMFAAEREKVSPDLMTVAKGLTGGYLPLAVTYATEEIYSAFLGKYEEFKTFFHGHTYTANPLACRAALASLELFETNNVLENLQPKIRLMAERLKEFAKLPAVGDIRHLGFMAGIELVRDKKTRAPFAWEEKIGIKVTLKAREMGAILRPLGPVIILMPPLAMNAEELDRLLGITFRAIQEVTENI